MIEKRILVIGDIMLDRYIEGHCDRISPEAPVPIVKANQETQRLGGAANVALNTQKLGITTALVGVLGKDEHGDTIKDLLHDNAIIDYTTQSHQTTVKTRVLAKSQQLLRIDREEYFTPDKHFKDQLEDSLNSYKPTLIIVSDYAKGVINLDIMKLVFHWSKKANCKVIVDPKDSDWTKYSGAYLIKPNMKEFEESIGQVNEKTDIEKALLELYTKQEIQNILVTRSEKGMLLCNESGIHDFETQKVEVYDVTGAGDTAIAVIAYGLCQDIDLYSCIRLATKASSYVITKNKTYAISSIELNRL